MRLAVWLVMALLAFGAPAGAGDNVSAAQSVIRSQELAFGQGDANAAYAYAAPGIQGLFPQADAFMSMVRDKYAPVYRHRSFEFGASQAEGDEIAQHVHIVDDNGEGWEALYTLQQQPDGSFKITGCSLIKAGQSV